MATLKNTEGIAEVMEFMDRMDRTLELLNALKDGSDNTKETLDRLGEIKGLCPEEIKISHALAEVCTHAGRIYDAVRHGAEPEEVVAFAQKIHRTREQLLQVFPSPKDGTWLLGFCLVCEREGNDADSSKCTHHDIHRLAVLAIAMLNIVPEYDLDVAAEMQEREQGDTDDS